MLFYVVMFICNMLIPVLMIVTGAFMYKKPPKNRNGFVGYRTAMSRKNEDTWKFAHDYCGHLWMQFGCALLVPSIVVQLPFLHANDDVIGIVAVVIETIQIAVMLFSIARVEKMLKLNFDENGRRRA